MQVTSKPCHFVNQLIDVDRPYFRMNFSNEITLEDEMYDRIKISSLTVYIILYTVIMYTFFMKLGSKER